MITINDLLQKIDDKTTHEEINKAYLYAKEKLEGKLRRNGDEYIIHALEVANILADLKVDSKTIISALLHEVITYDTSDKAFTELKNEFGEDIATIVDSISKINKLELNDKAESSRVYLRKVLVGLAEDVRVLYVKLADRLHNMRTSYALSRRKQKETAKETLDILVPIAHRLGIHSIKSELETLSLQYLKPSVYHDIVEKLNISTQELTDDLNQMKLNISHVLKDSGINFEIKGRVKSIYSIYNKLSSGKKWDDIFDILALRIFVEKESDCYTVLGLIHSKYKPIAKRFKDYVAFPKANMYQSLHTTVFGENAKLYEIQIRTYEMDIIAEQGIAAHWSYKEKGSKNQNIMEQKLELFRNIIEANDKDADLAKSFEVNFLSDLIYVYTPKGDVVELPTGSTPIDFAYRIHSNVGDTTVGALVNNVIVPFSHKLEDGDIVKINTNPNAKPSKDWLKIVKTTQAKDKIKSYFSKKAKTEYINKGREMLEKELRKRKLSFSNVFNDEGIKLILTELKYKDEEEIYLSIGSLRYTPNAIINLVTEKDEKVDDMFFDKTKEQSIQINYKGDIVVAGEDNILVNLAKCCMPVKGDDIVGYITKGDGISIHKNDCKNVKNKKERIIPVEWNYEIDNYYITNFYITVKETYNILPGLIELCTKKDIVLQSFNTIGDNIYGITIKVKNSEQLNDFLQSVNNLRHVQNVSKKIGNL